MLLRKDDLYSEMYMYGEIDFTVLVGRPRIKDIILVNH